MSNVLFTEQLVDLARQSLRRGEQVFDALVLVGGWHFESGTREFGGWCRALAAEVPGGIRQANRSAVLCEAYWQMRERAWELSRVASSNPALRKSVSNALNSFLQISKQLPDAVPTSLGSVPAAEQPARKPISDPVDALLNELSSYIGLDAVKREVSELVDSLRVDRMRRREGLAVPVRSHHVVFYGNPGTGKTTVAALLGKILKELGVVSKGQLEVTDRAGLVGQYLGQTAPQVKAKVESAVGGVLFIDEAYSLAPASSHGDQYGQEAVQQLLLLMEHYRNDLVVIVAGYRDEMRRFLDSNPGLHSRFAKQIIFEDYTPEQLTEIFEKFCSEQQYRLHESAREKLLRNFRKAYARRDKSFGNARLARNYFEKAISKLASRVVSERRSGRNDLMTIMESDISDDGVASDEKEFFPDLGSFLAAQGHPQKTAFIYPTREITGIGVIDRGAYCFTQNAVIDGREYCGTFDFGEEILRQILGHMPEKTSTALRKELSQDSDGIRTIPLAFPINFGIAAHLGKPQIGLREKFIPLVVMEVFP